jgi:hypothetical protein
LAVNISEKNLSCVQVEALSAVVSTVAESVRAHAIIDVGAGQVELHFLLITVLLVKLPNLVVLSTLIEGTLHG